MTERRPAHETVPDFVERQIREAQSRGAFDGLRGAGEPLPDLDKPHDELWWVKRKLRDEQVTDLPPALRARRDRDESLAAALAASDEVQVRRILEELNERIREVNRTAWYGPPTSVGPVDVDEVVARWRRTGGARCDPVTDDLVDEDGDPPPAPTRAPRRSWPGDRWRRARRRRRARAR